MPRIFINYRREDTSATAGRLYEWLAERFGDDQVFKDIDTIAPGRPWREAIDRAVGSSDLVLAVIGKDWLPELKRRSDDARDIMRHELETALGREASIIPILDEGASMPEPQDLPPSLEKLSDYQAFKLIGRFQYDKPELLKTVDRALGIPASAAPSSTTPIPPTQAPPARAGTNQRTGITSDELQRDGGTAAAATTQTADDDVEQELAKWNWGAFLLGPIWGLGNSVMRSFLVLVPFYGLYEWVLLGQRGNRWAWQNRAWHGIDDFRKTQRKWAIAGIIVLVIVVLIIIGSSRSSGTSGG